jgi:class 3 adenylate cyclase/tetratricopeptide (TPR) repeat protein
VLFCDLVGYTALCERLDPEDADRLLRDFSAATRRAIENYGGLVEKFIGDAAVGVFGVPAGREDDAERAVRVALRLRDEIPLLSGVADVELSARIGINTGLAVVRHDAATRAGEGFLVGDAVNTAARFQQLAPPGGIVVGKTTCELTEDKILYERLPAAVLKGKRVPVPCFLVRGPVSRRGIDPQHRFAAPLVDREVESGILRGLLEKAIASSRPQFSLIVGEAGIGKSRLVAEFFRYVENQPKLVRWRQGSCPAYGEDLAFRAIGEIAKQQLGVLDSDDAATIEDKLGRGLAAMPEPELLAARLRPLLGLPSVPVSREENYAAWGRFLASLAADMPAVLVFEDLHNASESTLDFLFDLVGHTAEVPLLVLGTARPEKLADHHETMVRTAELVNAHRLLGIELHSLSGGETGALVDHLLGDQVPSPETRTAVTDRAAGNPLFAEQLAFHVRSQVLSADPAEPGSGAKGTVSASLPASLPASLQTLIAARLDQLSPEEKIVLSDAAVVGQIFWTGAIAALDHGDRGIAEQRLAGLARRDLVHPERDSTLAGEPQFAFHHAIIREVAYGQLTRALRAAKHVAVARWLEDRGGANPGELAEVVANHYCTALELGAEDSDDVRAAAMRSLELAGRVAMGLDVSVAVERYARAVGLGVPGTPEHLALTHSLAVALLQAGRLQEAAATFDEVAVGQRSLGASEAADLATVFSWYAHSLLADEQVAFPLRPTALLGGHPTPELIPVLAMSADQATFACRSRLAMKLADRAIEIAREFDLPEPFKALEVSAVAACQLGRRDGATEYRRVLSRAESTSTGHELCVCISNYAETLLAYEGTRASLREQERALSSAERVHDTLAVAYCRSLRLCAQYWAGHWSDALAGIEDTCGFLEEHNDLWDLVSLRAHVALMHLHRGDVRLAQRSGIWSERNSRGTPIVPARVSSLIAMAAVHAGAGRHERALEQLGECLDLLKPTEGLETETVLMLPQAIWTANAVGGMELVGRLAGHIRGSRPFDKGTRSLVAALRHASRGDLTAAAEALAAAAAAWTELGFPFEAARALQCRGACLVRLGRKNEGAAAVAEAQGICARLGARAPSGADALLA